MWISAGSKNSVISRRQNELQNMIKLHGTLRLYARKREIKKRAGENGIAKLRWETVFLLMIQLRAYLVTYNFFMSSTLFHGGKCAAKQRLRAQ